MAIKCLKCGNEFESKRSTAKYCSDRCRKLAFQKNGKVSVPAPDGVSVPIYITDATGQEHPIDYEGRRKNRQILQTWADDGAIAYQQCLGTLAG